MSMTDELRKLADLRQEGHLTDAEFAEAKRMLLASGASAHPPSGPTGKPAACDGAGESTDKTYRSSRWSAGNLFFPDRLTLADDGMLFRKGALFGSSAEHINYRAIASVRVQNGIFLANITIETSGGSQPIYINGLWKAEAREIQDTIRSFQLGG